MKQLQILSEKGPFSLPPLPFEKTDMEPYMTASTFTYHHGKHHKIYVENLNNLIKGTEFEKQTLGEIISHTFEKPDFISIFNNAAQVFNHSFFWYCIKKTGENEPKGDLKQLIESSFNSYADFKSSFKIAAATQFGSGWAWLLLNKENGKLEIMKTENAKTPITNSNLVPLLTVDVWEHAYYLDYQNRRPDYLETFINYLINWEFVAENLSASK